ncbi:hypothetical protein ACROYT_G018200 [Oculina patagonica]
MIMTVAAVAEREKMADATTQPQRLVPLKYVVLSSFNFKVLGCIAVAIVLISMASAKATNPCSETQHWLKDANGSTSCVDCEPCFPGQGLSIECGDHIPVSFSADIKCLPCPQGVSFSGNHDTSSCTPCSSCAEDQVVLRNCSSEWDMNCTKRCHSKDRPVEAAPDIPATAATGTPITIPTPVSEVATAPEDRAAVTAPRQTTE